MVFLADIILLWTLAMKKNELENEKSFIDYLVKTIKDKNLASLEITRTLEGKHRLKIKINNSVSSHAHQERKTIRVDYGSAEKEESISKDTPQKLALDKMLALSTLWSASQTNPSWAPYMSSPSISPSAPVMSIAGPL